MYYVSTSCVGVCAQKPGHTDAFYNNTCLINSAAPEYASFNPGIGGDACQPSSGCSGALVLRRFGRRDARDFG